MEKACYSARKYIYYTLRYHIIVCVGVFATITQLRRSHEKDTAKSSDSSNHSAIIW
jgi:hypothetical protein